MVFTEKKFLSLSLESRHKKCAEFIKEKRYSEYNSLCSLLGLAPIACEDQEGIEQRFHHHLLLARQSIQESDFLSSLSTDDKQEALPFLGVWTFLDSLRSAHNIGSIIRTVEAFRLGPVRLSSQTLVPLSHMQLIKASRGTCHEVDVQFITSLEELPRPWIALETVLSAPPVHEASFSAPCTLIVGNEERGISRELLKQVDAVIRIPLRGKKNSLNVSCAFAIAAYHMAHTLN